MPVLACAQSRVEPLADAACHEEAHEDREDGAEMEIRVTACFYLDQGELALCGSENEQLTRYVVHQR